LHKYAKLFNNYLTQAVKFLNILQKKKKQTACIASVFQKENLKVRTLRFEK